MATVFSTATLKLNVDAKELNKELGESEKFATKALDNMTTSAKAFEANWKDLTHGIKDTKRIISGILISQGFYAISGALVGTAKAALEFSSSMETAAVSLEYFVDSAAGSVEAATKVQAYLREVKDFAAKTPFNTDQVLALSKYMQAVGVEMNRTQSVLTVITDAAAATGASTEQLQRITFALGQMITKGRIANEEIRQLANANIPIYDILQEELNLTGEEISNIGKHWIDADKAVVAILNGLEKRYKGAADRIADTFAGMTDTIVDDTKIIAEEALGGVFDKITEKTATIRDTLDEWRALATEKGMPGLFNDVILDIDPTGTLGNSILTSIGHLKNLKEAFIELYHAAQPVLSTLGHAFTASLDAGMIVLTAFSKTITGTVQVLDKLGIANGVVSKSFASLYVVYKASKFMSLFGQAAAEAGLSAYKACQGIQAILPACMSAQSGVVALTASLAGLITYGLAVVGLFSSLQSSFSGLSDTEGTSGLSKSWEEAYNEYEKQLEEYNKAIEDYRDDYRQSYEGIDNKKEDSTNKDDKDKKNKKKKGAGGETRWLASFDEVYAVPDKSTADFQDAVVEDLGLLLKRLPPFKFPKLGLNNKFPKMPEFKLGDIYGDDLWNTDGAANTKFWRYFLPAALSSMAIGLGRVFAKQLPPDVAGKVVKGDVASTPLDIKTANKLFNKYEKQQADIKDALDADFKKLNQSLDRLEIDGRTKNYQNVDNILQSIDARIKQLDDVNKQVTLNGETAQKTFNQIKLTDEQLALRQRAQLHLLQHDIQQINLKIQANKENPDLLLPLQQQLKELEAKQNKLLGGIGRAVGTGNLHETALRVEQNTEKIFALAENYVKNKFTKASNAERIYNVDDLHNIVTLLQENEDHVKYLREHLGDEANELIPHTMAMVNYVSAIDKNFKHSLEEAASFFESYNSAITSLNELRSINADYSHELQKTLLANADKMDEAIKFLDGLKDVNPIHIEEARELYRQAQIEAEKRAAAHDAKADAQLKALKDTKEIAEKDIKVKKEMLTEELYRIAVSRSVSTENQLDEIRKERVSREKIVNEIKTLLDRRDAYIKPILDKRAAGKSVNLNTLREAHEEVVKIDKRLKELLAKKEKNTPKDIIRPGKLNAGDKEYMQRIEEGLKEQLYTAQESARAQLNTYVWYRSIPARVKKAMDAAGLKLNKLLISTRDVGALLTGMDDRGRTALSIVQDVVKGIGFTDKMQQMSPSSLLDIQRAAAIKKYIGAALDVKLTPYGIDTFNGFKKTDDKTGLTGTIDYILSSVESKRGKFHSVWPNERGFRLGVSIRNASQELIDEVNKLGTTLIAGENGLNGNVIKANANILKILGLNDTFYESLAKTALLNSGGMPSTMHAIALLNTDFDFETVAPGITQTFKAALIDAFNNSNIPAGMMEKVSGRIFSKDAFELAQSLSGKGAGYTYEMFDKDFIAPLLNALTMDHSVMSYNALAKAIEVMFVDFEEPLKHIDFKKLSADYRTLLLRVANNTDPAALQQFIKVVGYGNKPIMGKLPLDPSSIKLPSAKHNTAAWLRAILHDDSVKLQPGAMTEALTTQLDTIVVNYTNDLAKGLPNATEHFRQSINKLHAPIKTLLLGEAISDDDARILGKLATAPHDYLRSLRLLDAAFTTMEETPEVFNDIGALLVSYNRQVNRLRTAARLNIPVTITQMSNLISTFENISDTLYLDTNKAAVEIGSRLQALDNAVRSAPSYAEIATRHRHDANADISDIVPGRLMADTAFDNLELPIKIANVDDLASALSVVARVQAMGGTVGRTADLIPQLMDTIKIPDGSKVIIADLETAGLRKIIEGAAGQFTEHFPGIIQASFMDAATGKMVNHFISSGNDVEDSINLLTIQTLLDKNNEELSDVAKAFMGISFEDFKKQSITLKELWTELRETFGSGNILTGWNATGTTNFDYNILRAAGMPDSLFTPGADIMKLFQKKMLLATGYNTKVPLSKAYEMLFGKFTGTAHQSNEDVLMAQSVLQALNDGTVDALFDHYKSLTSGTSTFDNVQLGIIDRLLATGESMRNTAPKLPTGATISGISDTVASLPPSIVDSMTKIGEKLGKATVECISDGVEKSIAAAADEAVNTLSSSTELVINGARKTTKEAIHRTVLEAADSTTWGTFKEAFEALSGKLHKSAEDFFSDFVNKISFKDLPHPASLNDLAGNVKEIFRRIFNKKGGIFKPFDASAFKPKSVLTALDDWEKTIGTYADLNKHLEEAVKNGADKSVITELTAQVEEAAKVNKKASTKLFESIMKSSDTTIKEAADTVATSFGDYINNLADDSELLAFYYSKASDSLGTFKTVGPGILTSKSDLLGSIGQTVSVTADMSAYAEMLLNNVKAGNIDLDNALKEIDKLLDLTDIVPTDELNTAIEVLKQTFDAGGEADKVFISAADNFIKIFDKTVAESSTSAVDILKNFADAWSSSGDDAAKVIGDTIYTVNDLISDNLVVLNAKTGELEFAGEAAQEAIEKTAGHLTSGLGTFAQKVLTAHIGELSVLDAVGIGIDVYQANKQNKEVGKAYSADLITSLSPSTLDTLKKTGVDISKELSSVLYTGADEVFTQSVEETLLSSGVATLAGVIAGLADLPATLITLAAGTLTSMGFHLFTGATGGDTAAYRYGTEYQKALKTGEFVDIEGIVNKLVGAGISQEEAERIANEANQHGHEQGQLYTANAWRMSSAWENNRIYDALYGGRHVGKKYRSDDIIALRAAQSLGVLNDELIGSTGLPYQTGNFLAINTTDFNKAQETLDVISELLGRTDLQLMETLHGFAVVDSEDKGVKYVDTYQEDMDDVLNMLGEHSIVSGDLPKAVAEVIGGNEMLSAAYSDIYGANKALAQSLLPELIEMFNEQTGAHYEQVDLERAGITEQLVKWASDTYTAQSQIWTALSENKLSVGHGTNRALEDTTKVVDNVNFDSLSKTFVNEMSKLGINLQSGTKQVETPLGTQTVDFGKISTDLNVLLDNMSGFRLDASKLEGNPFGDISNLQITTKDAEILAEAGIRVNADGSLDFMMSHNDAATGNERDLTLDRGDFSQKILDQLGSYKMSIDFDVGELDMGNFDVVKEKMTSAIFSMSDTVNGSLNSETQKVIDSIGRITDDGMLEITNSAILSGDKSMKSVLDSLDWYGVTDNVKEQLYTIAAVIGEDGAKVQDNIIAWANGIVIPSPISADQLTPDIEEAFRQIGVTFSEGADGLKMIISNTGEDLTDGVSLVDKEKWLSLGDKLIDRLKDLGVHVAEHGNDVLIDLNDVITNGAEGIVAIFTEKPELWDQIPEEMKAVFEKAGIMSDEGMLVIQTAINNGLTEISGGWLAAWEGLAPTTQQAFSELVASTSNGLLEVTAAVEGAQVGQCIDGGIVQPVSALPAKIQEQLTATGQVTTDGLVLVKGAVEGAEVGTTIDGSVVVPFDELPDELTLALTNASLSAGSGLFTVEKAVEDAQVGEFVDNGIVVPFDELPDELKSAMGSAATELEGQNVVLKGATQTAVGGMLSALSDTTLQVESEASQWGDVMQSAYEKALGYKQQLEDVKVSNSWKPWAGNTIQSKNGTYTVRYGGQKYSVPASSPGEAIAAINARYHVGINYDLLDDLDQKASGGTVDGALPVLAGEHGKELAIFPNGSTDYLSAGLYHLPAGTEILNAQDTKAVQKFVGERPHMQAYAEGTANASSFVPATAQMLRAAVGMRNAGVGPQNKAEALIAGMQQALQLTTSTINQLASSIATKIYEFLAPMFATLSEAEQNKVMAYVGTLIADDDGLRELERNLGAIRVQEGRRS